MPELNKSDSSDEDDQNVSDIEMEEAGSDEEGEESKEEMSASGQDGSSDEEQSDDEENSPQEESQEVVHRNIYVQFPRKRPDNAEEELKKVSDKIKYVRFPRQKKARFCYVHCDNETDAIDVEKLLRTTEICGFKLFVNRKRKIDDPDFRKKLKTRQIEKKIAKRDAKRLKKQLKQKSVKKVSKVNKIVVSNIPDTVSVEHLRQIFSSTVDFQYREKPNRIAFVTFSTTEEATKFIKKHPKVGGQELAVRPMLIVNRKKKQFRRKKNKGQESSEVESAKKTEEKKEEVVKEKTVKEKGVLKTKKIKEKKLGKKTKAKSSTGPKINYVALKSALG